MEICGELRMYRSSTEALVQQSPLLHAVSDTSPDFPKDVMVTLLFYHVHDRYTNLLEHYWWIESPSVPFSFPLIHSQIIQIKCVISFRYLLWFTFLLSSSSSSFLPDVLCLSGPMCCVVSFAQNILNNKPNGRLCVSGYKKEAEKRWNVCIMDVKNHPSSSNEIEGCGRCNRDDEMRRKMC